MYILVLESSTTNAKAMLYDTVQKTFAVASKAYEFNNIKEACLHDADYVFAATVELGRKLSQGKKIDAIALGTTWHNIMLCDKEMRPQTPVYQWTYTGASELCKKLREDKDYTLRYYQKTGCMVNITYIFFTLKLLRQNGWALENYKITGQGAYNTYKLTGEWVAPDVLVSGNGMLNTHKRDYDDELLKELGINRENLAELVTFKQSYPLSAEGAELLGLTPGIPVIPAMPDGALNQVGSGALADGIMTFSVGTSAAIRLSSPKPIIPEKPSTWCYLSPLAWICGAATAGSCNCVDWAKERLFGNDTSYRAIEDGIKNIAHNDEPVVFLPFLFGERCPGWEDGRSGGFFNIKPQHTAYDMYNSVLEGVLFNIYHCYTILTEVGQPPQRIKLSGGILRSPAWLQMCVDIFNVPMEADPAEHGSLMGGVVLAMEKLGLIGSLLEMEFPAGQIIKPNPENTAIYRERFKRYLYWYDRTNPAKNL